MKRKVYVRESPRFVADPRKRVVTGGIRLSLARNATSQERVQVTRT